MTSQATRIVSLVVMAAFPLLEIVVLVLAGQTIGVWRLALLVIITAILGTLVIRRVGLAMATRAMSGLGRGSDAFRPLVNAALLVVAGVLLIFPGLISDVLGLLLLVPGVRHTIINSGAIRAMSAMSGRADPFAGASARAGSEAGQAHNASAAAGDDAVTIEGEFERIDEKDVRPGTDVEAVRRRHVR